MSSTNKRLTDLFIPVGLTQPKWPSIGYDRGREATIKANTTTPVSTSLLMPNVPDEVKAQKENHETKQPNSPSSIRYTISGPSPENAITFANSIHVHDSDTRLLDGNSTQQQHRKEVADATPPIKQLTMRLSRATGTITSLPSTQSPLAMSRSQSETFTPSAKSIPVSETPILTPRLVTSLHLFNTPEYQRSHSDTVLFPSKLPLADRPRVSPRNESFPLLAASSNVLRSNSRSSTRSDRSCPPPSFPSSFYVKSENPQKLHETQPRSKHGRSSSLKIVNRSKSPFKNQLVGAESESSSQPPTTQMSYRRRPSDSSLHSDSQASTTSRNRYSTASATSSFTERVVHHYTSCSHISPPATRPLNLQPVLNESFDPPRSMIVGSCFDCDTAERRDLESAVLYSFNPRIAAHMHDLELIVITLDSRSPVSPLSPIKMAKGPQQQQYATLNGIDDLSRSPGFSHSRQGSQSSLVSADDDSEEILIRIQVLEDRIAELTMQRDREVKEIWKGYPQRWGPGTLGVVRGPEADRLSLVSASDVAHTSRRSMASSKSSSFHGTAEGRMRVDWIRD